ncbi:MAG TPA: hypothetical protein VJS67_08435 [Pseudonocardiaceae bacterium]|nr:hypothetical protein [Pseudonocardiaceae bacterium]
MCPSVLLPAYLLVLSLLTGQLFTQISCDPPEREPCSAPVAAAPAGRAPLRAVSLGFDDVQRTPEQLAGLDTQMSRSGVTAVGVSAGRADWTTFPWPAAPDAWSAPVRADGHDLFGDAIRVLGAGKYTSAVVDVFAERYLAAHPDLAARDSSGQRVPYQASTVELVNGELGRRLLAMIDYLARTYPIDSVDLTELQYHSEGFGEDDKQAYLAATGHSDWPRDSSGAIAVDDPSIGRWRSGLIADFVRRAADIVHAQHKELIVDVRVSRDDPSRDGEENGQCYRALLVHADRLLVWNYFGLASGSPEDTRKLAKHLSQLGRGRFIMSIGLWGPDNSVVGPDDLTIALRSSERGGVPDEWVTPYGLMTDVHWKALAFNWT